MTVIKAGGYATALLAILSITSLIYEANAWSADLKELNVSQQAQMLGLEKRILTRQIMQWSTKPTVSNQETQYKDAIVKQLESDKEDVVIKMRSLR